MSDVGRPPKDHGAKIEESPYKDTVVKWMSLGMTNYNISNKLKILGYPTSINTVKEFRKNFFNKLPIQKIEEFKASVQDQIKHKVSILEVQKESYTNLDILKALNQYILDIENRINELLARSELLFGLTPFEEKVLAKYYEMIKEARESIAMNQLKRERNQIIKLIVKDFAEILKKYFIGKHDEETIKSILRELIEYGRGLE